MAVVDASKIIMNRDEAIQHRPWVEDQLRAKESEEAEIKKVIADRMIQLGRIQLEASSWRGALNQILRALGQTAEEEPREANTADFGDVDQSDVNKSKAIVEVIRQSGAVGIEPRDIRAELKTRGLVVNDNYVYRVLNKKVGDGDTVVREGRRYWTKENRNGQ